MNLENRRYIWMMVGIPACGKSTWIKSTSFNKDVIILSTDNIIEKFCKLEGISYTDGFLKYIKRATDEFFNDFDYYISINRSIVIDRTNLTRKSRSRFLNIPKNYKKNAIVVFCGDSEEEYLNRLNSRKDKIIDIDIINNMKKIFEFPSKEEGFDDITTIYTKKDGEKY